MTIGEWRPARVAECEAAGVDICRLVLEPLEQLPHRAGQHYEIRLPGEELGRKYSVVSPPRQLSRLEFGVQLLPKGFLSPRLVRSQPGDRLEIRGPLGEAFVWTPELGSSLILLGGGVGITPLLSIHDHFTDCYPDGRMAFIVSAKSPKHIYRYELLTGRFQAHFTGGGPRLGRDDLQSRLGGLLTDPRANARICGPPGFIDVMVDTLIELGFSELRIRSEAFV